MVYIMNRYQIYIQPDTVETIDQVASYLDISRSQIIRDALERITLEYRKIIFAVLNRQKKSNPLLKMAGFAKSKTKNISYHVETIYYKD